MPNNQQPPHHSVGRKNTGAAAGQGRAASAAPQARTLDGTQVSAGHNPSSRRLPLAYPDLERIRHLVPLAALLSRYGVLHQLKRAGGQLRGCCPIHDGSNPQQFVVDLTNNSWHCFGDCNRGGGTLELVAYRERLAIPRAAALIAAWFAVADTSRRRSVPVSKARRKVMTTRPSHRAYVVEDRDPNAADEQSGFWTRVGAAWPHKDGKGLNIQIASGVAVHGRLVLREYTAEDEEQDSKRPKRAK